MNEFSQRLSICLKERKMSQKALAEKLRVTPTAVSGFVNGRYMPGDRTIADICRVLNINEQWLRTGEGEMEQETPESYAAELAERYNLNQFAARVINALAKASAVLNEDQFRQLVDIVVREMKNSGDGETVPEAVLDDVVREIDSAADAQSTAG